MTHEFKTLVEEAISAQKKRIKSVLASVVALDGSSYRRPGVRMLILENNKMIGAVSGGCVEKEIVLQAQAVFNTGQAKMMAYDGRYRLGCDGVLYILLELFNPELEFNKEFSNCIKTRQTFEILSLYSKEVGFIFGIGTFVRLNDRYYSVQGNSNEYEEQDTLELFKQSMPPRFKLVIIGAEHDAVQLCKYAYLTGWEVMVYSASKENKNLIHFPGAESYSLIEPENLDVSLIDKQTAVVLMTHNFAQDLRFLVALNNTTPCYIGVLGPTKRRNDLISQFVEYCPEFKESFLDTIHGPAGLNIGSETPQEIAVSIISEILAVSRKREPASLSKLSGRIHIP